MKYYRTFITIIAAIQLLVVNDKENKSSLNWGEILLAALERKKQKARITPSLSHANLKIMRQDVL